MGSVTQIRVDAKLCRGCEACSLACSLYHEQICMPSLARLRILKDMEHYQFQISICQQCDEPVCIPACPTEAMRRDEQGRVVLVEDECVQCGSCAEACPYDGVWLHPATGRYLKCDLCAGREGELLCVKVCPVGALTREPGE